VDRPRQLPQKHAWRPQRRWLIAGASTLAVVVMAIAFAPSSRASYKVAGTSVSTGTVERGVLDIKVRGNGILRPRVETALGAQVEGRVEKVHERAGATVAQGDPIVTLTNPALLEAAEVQRWELQALTAEYRALEQTLENSELDVKHALLKAEGDHADANLRYERESKLIRDHGQLIAEIEFKRTERTAHQLQETLKLERQRLQSFRRRAAADLAAKRAQINRAREQLARAQQQVAALTVRAPIAGMVQDSPLTNGQQVTIGQRMAGISDTRTLYAELKIPELQARELVTGQSAEIDTRNGIVQGRVTRVDPAVTSGVVKVDVELSGKLPPGLRPDLSIEGSIRVGKVASTLHVRRPTFSRPGQRTHVYRMVNSDTAERVLVEFGRSSATHIAIVRGLQAGDRIITSDTSAWGDPERVTLDN
jgi:HlyD family secretion protein